ncbi:MAG: tyrosine-type recombinase/integrase [Paenibacillaceae bacterium]
MAKKKELPPGVRGRNGNYTYRFSVNIIENGKKRRKQKETISYATPTEAFNAGILIKAELLKGTYVDEKDIPFDAWCDKWLKLYLNAEKKSNSVSTRKSAINRLKLKFGDMKLKDVTPMQYQEYLFELKNEGLSKNTLLVIHSTMSLLFKKAVKPPYELIARDITADAELPSFAKTVSDLENNTEIDPYLEKEQLSVFIKKAYEIAGDQPTEKDRLTLRQCARALHILAFTGLRIGELCSLESNNIDEINKSLKIIKTLYFHEGVENFKLETPKNKSSIRDVDVTKDTLALFKIQEHEKRLLRVLSTSYYTKKNFVFANARRKPGYPLSPSDIERFMKDALKAAELPTGLTPHSLRHTYTSLSAEAGIDLSAIQRQLGHTNDTMTTRIYLHVTKARRRVDVEKLEGLMDGLI